MAKHNRNEGSTVERDATEFAEELNNDMEGAQDESVALEQPRDENATALQEYARQLEESKAEQKRLKKAMRDANKPQKAGTTRTPRAPKAAAEPRTPSQILANQPVLKWVVEGQLKRVEELVAAGMGYASAKAAVLEVYENAMDRVHEAIGDETPFGIRLVESTLGIAPRPRGARGSSASGEGSGLEQSSIDEQIASAEESGQSIDEALEGLGDELEA